MNRGQQIQVSFARLRTCLQCPHFDSHVRIPLPELIRPETLAKILQPKSRIRFVGIGRLHLSRAGLALIKELLTHRVDERLGALTHANADADSPSFIVLLKVADLCFGLLIALAFEDISQTGKSVAQFFGCVNPVGFECEQTSRFHKVRARLLFANGFESLKFEILVMIQHPFANPKMDLPKAQRPIEWILQQLVGSDRQPFAVCRLHLNANLRFEKTVACGTRGNNQSGIFDKGGGEEFRFFPGEFEGPKRAFELSITQQPVPGDAQLGGFRRLSRMRVGWFRQRRVAKQQSKTGRHYLE